MIFKTIKKAEDWLGNENRKSAYLAFLRVAMSLWLLKDLLLFWPSFDTLYSNHSFLVREDNNILLTFPGSIAFIRNHYMVAVDLYIILIIMNIFGIGRWMTGLAVFIMMDLFQKLNTSMVNGGDKMGRLVLLYLVFAGSYDYLVLYKKRNISPERKKLLNMISNIAAYSLMLQLCLSYFCSGISKLTNEWWRHGTAIYYAMSMERFNGTPLNNYLVHNAFFVKVGTYYTLFFEIAFSFFVWIKKFRKPFIIGGLILHLFIYIFMMLYSFEEVFILQLGIFLTNEESLRIARRFKRFFFRSSKKNSSVAYSANS